MRTMMVSKTRSVANMWAALETFRLVMEMTKGNEGVVRREKGRRKRQAFSHVRLNRDFPYNYVANGSKHSKQTYAPLCSFQATHP